MVISNIKQNPVNIFSGLVQCFDHGLFVMELVHWGWRGKWKWEEATVITQSLTLMRQCTGKGPTTSSNLPTCHWNSVFEFWKQVKPVFNFGHSHPFSWETEWWKRWFKTNPNKCWNFENRWDPHDLDDKNKKLSDITQNSLHPNKALVTILYKAK